MGMKVRYLVGKERRGVIRCSICKAEHPENTLFCDKCGSYLLGGVGAGTAPLVAHEVTVTWAEREKKFLKKGPFPP